MKAIQILFLFFLVVPFVEIFLLLQVGGLIGVFPTIFLVVLTAVWGASLLRQQGFATWQRLQTQLSKGEIPAEEMIEGPILLVGGALLLTPGFFTDLLGFACLLPAFRQRIAQYIIERHLLDSAAGSIFRRQREARDVIEGVYEKRNDQDSSPSA